MNDAAFSRLLQTWNCHQDLRRRGASVAELAQSRFELDAARDRLR